MCISSSSLCLKQLWFLAPLLLAAAVVVFTATQQSSFLSYRFRFKDSRPGDDTSGFDSRRQTFVNGGLNPMPAVKNRERCPNIARIPGSTSSSDRKYSDLEMVEADLAQARAAIREAKGGNETLQDPDYVPDGPMYWDPKAFHRG
ncbi:hypothetical protein OROGR_029553 [Orobanche gracilis]